MEYYSFLKNKDIMSFGGKWMKLENIFPPGMVAHDYNASTWDAEAGGFQSLSPA